jgi:23S rRNA (adenine2503-C2)-methyltransferase
MLGEMTSKKDIRKIDQKALEAFFVAHGEKPYRAKQVMEWLWKKSVLDFDEMSNLSQKTRALLQEYFHVPTITVHRKQQSKDGTIKNAVKLSDGLIVESVLIPTSKRITACVSSQVGCSLDCTFCATAKLKRMRNLNADEIYDQVVTIKRQAEEEFGRPLTNIVFMGMGEPLLNYQEVIKAIDRITSDQGLMMASKRITLSTVGIAKMIRKMADDGVKFNLAVSLHAAIDATRTQLMPINQSNNLNDLADAIAYWYKLTKRKVTYEYVVWEGVNDNEQHARALLEFCKRTPSKVNLIEYNPIGDGKYAQGKANIIGFYQDLLERNGIVARVRKSRGQDIDAACGQLANKFD